MEIFCLIFVFALYVSIACDKFNDSPKKRIKRLDDDPFCTVKSNEWHRKHNQNK